MNRSAALEQAEEVAVICMAVRFPKAKTVEQYWQNLREGREAVSFFSDEELRAEGYNETQLSDPSLVKAAAVLEDIELFDAPFFGFSPREAEITDPQQRVFLECAWEALERAGYNAEGYAGRVGVYAGAGLSTYLLNNLMANTEMAKLIGNARAIIGNDVNYLTTWVSYKLNLKGPSVTVQTACSTSLVAVHLACQSLLNGECDMALAGGVNIKVPQKAGYLYREGGINSPDGHCRAFDARAAGTIGGNGVGVVVLKRLADALADGDDVQAVIKGSAVNNDGSLRIGYTAPSVGGQAAVIAEAHSMAGTDSETITYVEAHGTGTALGDPIELTALTQAFRLSTAEKGFCAIGSVKSNMGHLDAAAGVAGLIKTVLALKHKLLPPSLHFERPNPKIDFANSPFYVNTTLREWEAGEGGVRRAGVSSLGIGGTNAHVVVEEAPPAEASSPSRPWQLLLLSAKTGSALETATANLARAVREQADLNLADVSYTLQVGRKAFGHRRAVVCRDLDDAATALEKLEPKRVLTGVHEGGERPIGFMFTGQGAQYVNMGLDLYRQEATFRECVDECAELLVPQLGTDLRKVLFPPEASREWASGQLQQTRLTQPALFVIEYALTKLLAAWGVRPSVMVGHSVGEYVAACVAGVFTLEEGLRLVAARGRLMQELPPGAMLAIPLTEPEVEAFLNDDLSVAAVNGAARCVVSGPVDALEELEERLRKQGVTGRRLQTSHAFHSAMMEPIIEPFKELFAGVSLKAPRTPYVSNVTGKWITAGEATDPRYWARHLRRAVRFSDGVALLLKEPQVILLEVGPGQVLSSLARQQLPRNGEHVTLSTLRQQADEGPDGKFILNTLGRLWLAGCPIDWEGFYAGERRRRVQLPTYPFERRPYWITPSWKTAMKQRLEQQDRAENGSSAHAAPPPPPPTSMPSVEAAAPVPQAAAGPGPARRERIHAKLGGLIKALTGVDADEIDSGATIFELGVDSLLLIQVGQRIEDEFKIKVPFRLFFEELSTLTALVEYLDLNLPPEALPPDADEPTAHAVVLQQHLTESAPALLAEPAAGGAQSTPPSSVMESIIRQQLQIMAQQLEVLRNGHGAGEASAPAGAPAATASPNGAPRPNAPKDASPERKAAEEESLPAASLTQPGRHEREVFVPHKPIRTEAKTGLSARQQKHLDDLTARYAERTRESKRHAQTYRPVFADSRNSLMFRSLWKELAYPIVVRRSSGSRLWDIDGNEYVDLTMGFGVNLFGHSPDFVVEALETQLEEGMQLGPQSYLAGQVAALISELTGAERVVFANTGTEAVMAALRLARTVTRRDKIALFAGAYHGTYDGTLARAVTAGGARRPVPVAPGVPQRMVEDILVLDYDSPESLELLRAHAHELAAVLVEPVQSRRPALQPREFLHEVRRLTREAGAALIFDEVITGFRIHPGGAQAWFGVEADLAIYGKVIGGGMPIGVVAGKARYLDAIDGGMWSFGDDSYPPSTQTFYTGTFCKHPLVMAAAYAVLNRLKEGGPLIQQQLNQRTARLAADLNGYFARNDVPTRVEHFGSLFHLAHTEEMKFPELLTFHLIEKGVYVWEGGTRFLSTAHTDEDVERVVSAFKESVEELREGGIIRGAARGLPAGGNPAALLPDAEARDSAPGAAPASGDESKGVRTVPLTEAQRQLWILTQMGEEVSRAYNESVTLRMRGALEVPVLRDAVQKVVDRHEGLRTTFGPDGDVQLIHPAMKLDFTFLDFSGLEEGEKEARVAERMRSETGQAFDLVRGPLLRACLIKVEAESHLLVLTGHHLVTDSRSFGVLIGELKIIYSAGCQGIAYQLSEPMPYSEYARGELQRTEHPDMAVSEKYWRQQFAGALRPMELPADRPRPPVQTYKGARHCVKLDAALGRELKTFSSRQGVTLYVTLLAGFKTLLRQLTSQKDVVVGINAAAEKAMGNRSLIGFRLHPLALRSQAEDEQTFAQYLATVRTLLLDAYEHQDFPLIRLAKELRLQSGSKQQSLVSAAFNLDRSNSEVAFHGVQAEVVSNATGSAKLDVYLNVTDAGGELLLECDYNSDLFDAPTIGGWLGHFEAILKACVANPQLRLADLPRPPSRSPRQPQPDGAEPGPARPVDESSNLTSLQFLIWAGQKMNPGAPLYTNATYYIIPDKVEPPHFRRAFQALLDRSDALRTVFEEDGAGVPQQRVVEGMRHEVEYVDLSASGTGAHAALQSWMSQRCRRPFDLLSQAFDTALVKLGESEYAWYINLHHAISDAWSATLMVRYQSEYYALSLAGRLEDAPQLPLYAEFIEGERKRAGSPAYLEAKAYWERKLARAAEPITFYGKQPVRTTTRVQRISYNLGPERTAGLKEVARQFPGMSEDAKLLNVFAALLCAYLYRVSGTQNVSLGVPFHNRLSKSAKETLGLFIQIFPLLVTVDEEDTVASLVRKISAEFFDAFRHREYPVANPNQDKVYDVMLDFINAALLPTFRGMPLSDGGWIHPGHGEQSLNVQIQDFGARGSFVLEIDLSCDIFDEGERRRVVSHLVRMLDSFLQDPARPVGALDLLPEEEKQHVLVDFNRTGKAAADGRSFISLFEAEVEKTPGRVAVVCGDEELTYGELNARADLLARRLGALGVGQEVLVALLFKRGVDLLVSILAVFKAGGAYLPLDPYNPPARLRQMLIQSRTLIALAATGLMHELRQAMEGVPFEERPRLVSLEALLGGKEPAAGHAPVAPPAGLSYVIYTSGSTGLPKGAMIEQAGMLNHLYAKVEELGLTQADTVAQTASQSFDISVWQFLVPLLVGGRVHIVDDETAHDPRRLLTLIESEAVTILETVPSMLRSLLAEVNDGDGGRRRLPTLRWLIVTGEALPPDLCQQWLRSYPDIPLLNAYGPTECSDDVTHFIVREAPAAHELRVPVGTPVRNTRLYILDRRLMPVPLGVAAELYVGGAGVGRGYLNDPRRTAEVFVPDPYAAEPGARLYKTGDLARQRPDGAIEFLGRVDHQVKIRGFRIELGDIEATLNLHPDVRQSVVLAWEEAPGDKRLAAYVVPSSERTPTLRELRAFLKGRLPEYMTPSAFVMLDELPLTTNGKVNRQALPPPDPARAGVEDEFAPPSGFAEEALAEIWAKVLGVERVGIHDNFFELGGDSILGIQVASRANQAGLRLTPVQLFQHQTIAELARVAGGARAVVAAQETVEGPTPLTPIQHWFFEHEVINRHHWNQALMLRSQAELDAAVLEQAVAQLLAHHDALRMRFTPQTGGWQQHNDGLTQTVPFTQVDLSLVAEAEQKAAIERAAGEAQASLNLGEGPLLRVVLMQPGGGRPSRLLIAIHHLVVDGVSWRILLEDLETLYTRISAGKAVALPPKTTSFKYWAERLRQYANSGALDEERAYWLEQADRTAPRLPLDDEGGHNTRASADAVTVSLSAEETRALLQEVPKAHHTQINDLLLTALAQVFARWTKEPRLLVALEGHGREELFDEVDLSRTVGFFTTTYPAVLEIGDEQSVGGALQEVKNQLRRIPRRGIGYGLLRYLSEEEATRTKLGEAQQADVVFNYLGQTDQMLPESAPFQLAGESSGPATSRQGQRPRLLELNAVIAGGRLRVDWVFSRNKHRRETIDQLAQAHAEALRALIAHCLSPEESSYAPADFFEFKWTQADLDKITAVIGKSEM